jgi:uncharacterized protein
MVRPYMDIQKREVASFCRRHHIRKLSLFGSVLQAGLKGGSDVDFLVEFDPRHVPGLITLAGMEIELSRIIGRKADVRTPEDLSRYFRDEVLRSARVHYAKR